MVELNNNNKKNNSSNNNNSYNSYNKMGNEHSKEEEIPPAAPNNTIDNTTTPNEIRNMNHNKDVDNDNVNIKDTTLISPDANNNNNFENNNNNNDSSRIDDKKNNNNIQDDKEKDLVELSLSSSSSIEEESVSDVLVDADDKKKLGNALLHDVPYNPTFNTEDDSALGSRSGSTGSEAGTSTAGVGVRTGSPNKSDSSSISCDISISSSEHSNNNNDDDDDDDLSYQSLDNAEKDHNSIRSNTSSPNQNIGKVIHHPNNYNNDDDDNEEQEHQHQQKLKQKLPELLSSLSKQQEEIEDLIYDRDKARQEANTSKETLSCVMEAVQILTTQMKKTHIEMMSSTSSEDQMHSVSSASATNESTVIHTNTRTETDTVEEVSESVEEVSESVQEVSESVEHDLSSKDRFGNKHTTHSSKQSIASSSIATYMSEENKRFSELLELSSSSNLIQSEHLQQIKSDLMALGHSCQMVGENAHFLHNEASKTFLADLQTVNSKLNELQIKYKHSEKVALQLYKENKRLKGKLEKNKNERRVLVQKVKMLLEEQSTKKQFEDHLLKAWDMHERLINTPKQSQRQELDTVDGGYSSNVNTPSPPTKTQQESKKHISTDSDDKAPTTPHDQILTTTATGSTGPSIIPSSSSSMSPGCKEIFRPCPTTNESSVGTVYSNSSTYDEKIVLAAKIPPSNKAGWLSFLPALQLTPTTSMIDLSENAKAKLTLEDLKFLEDSDGDDDDNNTNTNNNSDDSDINMNSPDGQRKMEGNVPTSSAVSSCDAKTGAIITNSTKNRLEVGYDEDANNDNSDSRSPPTKPSSTGAKIKLKKLDTSTSRTTPKDSSSSSSSSSPENNLFFFFGGGPSSSSSTAATPNAKTVITVKLPQLDHDSKGKDDLDATRHGTNSSRNKLPPAMKVAKRKKKQYRQYMLTDSPSP